eukprot:6081718-Amphidinium_carterae.1
MSLFAFANETLADWSRKTIATSLLQYSSKLKPSVQSWFKLWLLMSSMLLLSTACMGIPVLHSRARYLIAMWHMSDCAPSSDESTE